MADRDDQPASPWRSEDPDALTASGGWPSSLDAVRAKSALSQIKQTLAAANPPRPKPAPGERGRLRRTG